jgi:copper(I)-binding protein
MLMGLAGPLREGERIELTLTFEKAGNVKIDVPVGAVAAGSHDHGAASSGESGG